MITRGVSCLVSWVCLTHKKEATQHRQKQQKACAYICNLRAGGLCHCVISPIRYLLALFPFVDD